MVKKTNLLVIATLIFLTAGTAGCGPDTDIQGTKIPDDHPFRSGKIAGVVYESDFDWYEDVPIRLLVRDEKQLTTIVILNYKPDHEKITKSGDRQKKYKDLKMAFENKYHGTRVECAGKDFLVAPESEKEKEPGILGAIFGSCEQDGEPVEDWLESESMVVEFDSIAKAKSQLSKDK